MDCRFTRKLFQLNYATGTLTADWTALFSFIAEPAFRHLVGVRYWALAKAEVAVACGGLKVQDRAARVCQALQATVVHVTTLSRNNWALGVGPYKQIGALKARHGGRSRHCNFGGGACVILNRICAAKRGADCDENQQNSGLHVCYRQQSSTYS